MYMEHARHKDKGKGFGITQGRGRASYRSGVNLLFMASLNVFRTERQYFVLRGWEERECLKIVSFKKTRPRGFSFIFLNWEAAPQRVTFFRL